MTISSDVVAALKRELKTAQLTYADLATAMGMAESSVKRMMAKGDMSLARLDTIFRVLRLDLVELARRAELAQPGLQQLSLAQERAVVADPRLLLVAICVLSQWTAEQICAGYALTDAQCVQALAELDRIGIIELRPFNRYRVKLAKTFRWLPHGPVMQFFREHTVLDYFSGGFDAQDEALLLVHGALTRQSARALVERLQKVALDFSQQHLAQTPQKAKPGHSYTMLLALRSGWEFGVFADLRRNAQTRVGKPASKPV